LEDTKNDQSSRKNEGEGSYISQALTNENRFGYVEFPQKSIKKIKITTMLYTDLQTIIFKNPRTKSRNNQKFNGGGVVVRGRTEGRKDPMS
jgi:hypothetical protein